MSEFSYQKIQKLLKNNEAFLVTNRHNLRYLANYTGTNGFMLITHNKAIFFTDARYNLETKKVLPPGIKLDSIQTSIFENLAKVLQPLKVKILIFEAKDLRYSFYQDLDRELKKNSSRIFLKPQKDLVEKLRETKTQTEIKYTKKAQQIAEKAFLTIRSSLKPGLTEKELAWQIEKKINELGADGISFPPIVAFGSNSSTPHHQNSNKKLKKGDLILLDIGAKYRGYCSDMTRMIFTAKPTAFQAHLYNLVLQAQLTAIEKIKKGINGKEADNYARSIITQAGYKKNFQHSLGHGVGLQIHEAPNASPLSTAILNNNSIITVEPGIYLPGKFGIRIEDMILITKTGNKNLTSIPKSLNQSIKII